MLELHHSGSSRASYREIAHLAKKMTIYNHNGRLYINGCYGDMTAEDFIFLHVPWKLKA